MEQITLEFVQNTLFKRGYCQNEKGQFLIPFQLDFIGNNWEEILDAEIYPAFAFRNYLEEHAQDFHQNWAESLFDRLFEKEYSSEDCEQFSKLALQMSVVEISYDQLLHEKLRVNIGVDTGDSGWDYTANTVPPAYGADHELKESEDWASMVWLVKQQGHTKAELYHALKYIKKDEQRIQSPFVASVASEVWHTLSIFTQLFFLVEMTVEDLLILNTLKRWHRDTRKWGGYLIVNKEAVTGFFASFVGSSSKLGIQLEQEVKLPVKYIAEILPDDAYYYPVSDVFGSYDFWNDGNVVYCSLPKHFRIHMEEFGLPPVRKNVRRNIDKPDEM